MSTADPAAEPGALVSVPWWRNVAERAVRQALQVAAPILVVIVGSGNGLNLGAAVGAIVVAVALSVVKSVVKSVAGVRADADSPLTVQLLDRAASALAFTLLSFLPVEWADWASVDWGKALGAAVAAAVLSLVQFYLNPPAFAASQK